MIHDTRYDYYGCEITGPMYSRVLQFQVTPDYCFPYDGAAVEHHNLLIADNFTTRTSTSPRVRLALFGRIVGLI